MTNQEAKHKAIQEAYGEYWEQLSQEAKTIALRNDGWVFWKDFPKGISETESDANTFYRPKSLSGIEDNNGWVRIEQDRNNLPNKSGVYTWMNKNGRTETFDYYTKEDCDDIVFDYRRKALMSSYYTHYRPVEEIPNHIY